MSIKPRRNRRIYSDEKMVVYAGLFFLCAVLAALGVGALAFWSFLPAAIVMECLPVVAPARQGSRL